MHFTLLLPANLHADVVAHALAERPRECCGLLAGEIRAGVGYCTHRFPLVNALASPVEFVSDAASMFAAVRAMRAANVEVLAVYHSHPTSDPVPSRLDRERNYSLTVMNLIIGLTTEPPVVRAWWLTPHDAQEADWRIAPST